MAAIAVEAARGARASGDVISGTLLAAGSAALFIGTIFYARLPPELGLPALPAERAQALADALKANGLFRDNGLIAALSKSAAGPQLSFVIGSEGALDPRVAAVFQILARRVAPSVGGLPLTVNIVDPTLQVKASFLIK